MKEENSIFSNCLYFSANSLARSLTKLADESFRFTGLSPSHAFVMLTVIERPGLNQSEISREMMLKPSTITRFLDILSQKDLISRFYEGKISRVEPTEEGLKMEYPLRKAWENLSKNYSRILGADQASSLTSFIHESTKVFEMES